MRGFDRDFSNYLPSDTDFVSAANIWTNYRYGDTNDNEKGCQCDLLTEDGGLEIDPTRLSYQCGFPLLPPLK